MKVTYTITLNDVKKACFEAVKTIPLLKKRRVIYSVTVPFLVLLFPLIFPFLSWTHVFIIISTLIIYFYFYGYALSFYTSIKALSYKHSTKVIPMAVELEKESIIVEQSFTRQKFTSESLFMSMETKKSYILFPDKKNFSFILVKKSPDNLSEKEIIEFNEQMNNVLFNLSKKK